MAHQPMLLPDPSERPFLPEGSFAPARGPEWLEEDSGNYLAELAAKLASHGGGESSADLALDLMLNKIVDQARLATAASGAAIALFLEMGKWSAALQSAKALPDWVFA